MKHGRARGFLWLWLALGFVCAANAGVRYQLLQGSQIIDDCAVCDRLPLQQTLRGTFELRLIESNPLFSRYAIENIQFYSDSYKISGGGEYQAGGEVALVQNASLSAQVQTLFTNVPAAFTNDSPGVTRLWPMLSIALTQTNGTLFQTFHLQIAAAPLREIWFSTAASFHSAALPLSNNFVSHGDLLASTGRIVRRNADLLGKSGGGSADLGLDGVDLQPGGEIAFSTEIDGVNGNGDVIEARSGKVFRSVDLLSPLLGSTNPPDLGLDALQIGDEPPIPIYFSVKKDFTGAPPALELHHGDLLWVNWDEPRTGGIFKRNSELLRSFAPPDTSHDYGLDAIYIWPGGEIWFSIEEGFQDAQLGPITSGDILSDRGYIAYRNLDLLQGFAPIEDAAQFGLDALTVISDVAASTAAGAKMQISLSGSGGTIHVGWSSGGRVFQLERSDSVLGPFVPITPITPDFQAQDTNSISGASRSFYRLVQW